MPEQDLGRHALLAEDDVLAFCELYRLPYEETNAKTGENVAAAFARVAEMGLRAALSRMPVHGSSADRTPLVPTA